MENVEQKQKEMLLQAFTEEQQFPFLKQQIDQQIDIKSFKETELQQPEQEAYENELSEQIFKNDNSVVEEQIIENKHEPQTQKPKNKLQSHDDDDDDGGNKKGDAIIQKQAVISQVELEKVNPYNKNLKIGEFSIKAGKLYQDKKQVTYYTHFSNTPLNPTEVLAIRMDPTDSIIAAGYTDGGINLFDIQQKKMTFYMAGTTSLTPVTCLRWRPHAYPSKAKNVLVAGNADGSISHYHALSGKLLSRIYEADNHVLCLDYKLDGTQFATSGKDFAIRIYDENTKTVNRILQAATWQSPGHSNRVFSIKFLNDNQNLLISGGWDGNIHLWDIRQKRSIRSFYGPTISGDSLDYKDGIILAGSYRSHNQLQLFDVNTGKLLEDLDWEKGFSYDSVQVYAAQFSKQSNKYMYAGSAGLNELKIYDRTNQYNTVATVSLRNGIYTIDSGNVTNKIAFAGIGGSIYVVNGPD